LNRGILFVPLFNVDVIVSGKELNKKLFLNKTMQKENLFFDNI
jgi:hypothetical protein